MGFSREEIYNIESLTRRVQVKSISENVYCDNYNISTYTQTPTDYKMYIRKSVEDMVTFLVNNGYTDSEILQNNPSNLFSPIIHFYYLKDVKVYVLLIKQRY